ncbi:mitochondrial 37S ribosomal protein rsm10 [Leucoagaricus gongylophorus]
MIFSSSSSTMLKTLAMFCARRLYATTRTPYQQPGFSLKKAAQHQRTHEVAVASVHLRSHHPQLLDLFTHFASHTASALHIPTSPVIFLPTQRSLWTVIRSPFVHKKSQENFERKVHKRVIKAWDAHPRVVDTWLRYLRLHMLGGVAIKVTTWEHLPLSVGSHSSLSHVDLTHQHSLHHQVQSLGTDILRQAMPDVVSDN